MSDTSLAGQVALVTGASRGIGRAIAAELGRAGATVIGTATSADGAQRIGTALASVGIPGAGLVMDVAGARSTQDGVVEVAKRFGDVTILVNNAGITRDNLLLRMRDDEWDSVLETDLKSAFRLCKLVLRPMMKARYGRIINITSVVGSIGNAGQTNYAAAKAGLSAFTRSLAREIGSRGITVNCVAPGFIETDMTRALTAEQRARLLENVPVGRFGAADEVAACVGFLASARAGYVTGATLHVNGGMFME
jgi:3-oxoacyl-[acyl-carrier protein] reductase